MCVFKVHINYPFLKKIYEKLKKLSKQLITFSFFQKKFPKVCPKSTLVNFFILNSISLKYEFCLIFKIIFLFSHTIVTTHFLPFFLEIQKE